jgi:hypothetical protein
MYNNLNPDYSVYTSDDCKANCCLDGGCDVWQWSDDPLYPPNCWYGASDDYGDSGGVYWMGEQGRCPAPGPAPDPGPGPAPPPGAPGPPPPRGTISAHNFFEDNWVYLALGGVGLLGALYVAAKVRNGGSVGALVKDGASFATHGSGAQYHAQYGATGTQPPNGAMMPGGHVTHMSGPAPSPGAYPPGVPYGYALTTVHATVAEGGGRGGRGRKVAGRRVLRHRCHRHSADASAMVVYGDGSGRKKRRKKKKPSGGGGSAGLEVSVHASDQPCTSAASCVGGRCLTRC